MSWSIQDHADAGLALLRADTQLRVFDGAVRDNPDDPLPEPPYVLVYTFRSLPTGLVAPDRVPLTGASIAVDMQMYCHCVGANAVSARAMQGRVEALLLDVTPVVAGRTCWPIRWLEGAPSERDEQAGPLVVDQVDVYGWSSQPG